MTEQPRFSWRSWLVGFVVMCASGGFLNVLAMAVAYGRSETFGFFFGLVPGVLLVIFAYTQRRTPFGLGFITGAMVVALAGGICGAAVSKPQ